MTRMRTTAVWTVLAVTGAAAAGCGLQQSATAQSPVSAPTSAPAAPSTSQAARDTAVPTGWITASVTRGGSGPCFGVKSADGTEFALHSIEARSLQPGDRIKIRVSPSRLRISCGAGTQVQLQELEPVG